MESINILQQDSNPISYEECLELWEDENTLVHKDRSERIIKEISTHICDVCGLNRNDILLNVGCGDGLFDGEVSDSVKKLYCVDFSSQKLAVAKEKWGNRVNYYQHNFLLDYPTELHDVGINKIYSYGVMQYCNPDDAELFLLNQLKLCVEDIDYVIAHIDVPDKSKAYNYYKRLDPSITEDMITDKVRSLFNDGSYWHDMGSIQKIANKYDLSVEMLEPHYWDYRTDIVFRFHGPRV